MPDFKVRQSARNVGSDAEMLRQIFAWSYEIMDDRGYGYLAGIHGYPLPQYCEHGNTLFLPWHRAYLNLFERTLSEINNDFYLPWWDWSAPLDDPSGIPTLFAEEQSTDGTANPLQSAPMSGLDARARELFFRASLSSSVNDPQTVRQTGDPEDLPLADELEELLDAPTYVDLNARLESYPHNFIHVWVGRSMSAPPSAAFDPIFWAHHGMVDRLWYLWQLRHPGAQPPAQIIDAPLAPFRLTVRDVLNVDDLGYTYAQTEVIA